VEPPAPERGRLQAQQPPTQAEVVPHGRHHATGCHADWGWDRDDDGDGVREVHDDTPGELWLFLRPSRGVSKKYLYQYVALFEWGHNAKRATPGFLRALSGVESATKRPT
jgi:hypothetical protein